METNSKRITGEVKISSEFLSEMQRDIITRIENIKILEELFSNEI
jgi:hypothetical protein